jgi:hypothetical protein
MSNLVIESKKANQKAIQCKPIYIKVNRLKNKNYKGIITGYENGNVICEVYPPKSNIDEEESKLQIAPIEITLRAGNECDYVVLN